MMRGVRLERRILLEKINAARKDVKDLDGLRGLPAIADGTSFLVGKTLFVWMKDDATPDDDFSSIGRKGAAGPGRFRRAGMEHPLKEHGG